MTHAEQIAAKLITNAKRTMGAGWDHISPALRRGLVMAEVIGVTEQQDEEIPAAKVLAFQAAIVKAADALLATV
jgi:hypothetical protein